MLLIFYQPFQWRIFMTSPFLFPSGTWLDQNNQSYQSSHFMTGWVIVYSYPKDNTPGCTTQACDLRDRWNQWKSTPVRLFGLSADSIESHQKFASEYTLPFPLLSDPDLILCKALGIWGEQTWGNHTYMGLERSTWIFWNGQIKSSFRQVQVKGHWDQVWEKWKQLDSSLELESF